MAHLVESMAYVGDTPWHGLGNQLAKGQSLQVWQQQAGMNWEILESPVRYETHTSQDSPLERVFDKHKVLYRSDNFKPLSVVGSRYHIVQPIEVLGFYKDLTEALGFELETAGILKEGRKFWALARTGDSVTFHGRDLMNAYVLLATSCDGTLATTAQFTSIRVVCNNTLAVALGNSDGAVKVPHSTKFDAQYMKNQLGITSHQWSDFSYRLKQMSNRKVNTQEIEYFYRDVFSSKDKEIELIDSHYGARKALELFNGRGRGAELSSAHNTVLGLLNSITEYVDHEQRARNNEFRLDSAWFGQGALLKQKAAQLATNLIH